MLKKILLGLLATLLIMQAFQTEKITAAADPAKDFISLQKPPQNIEKLLRAACYDCHSTETVWPWYSYVNPIGWQIGGHVRNGRKKLNFSTWADYDEKKKDHKLEECSEEVGEGKMPLKSYTYGHSEAKLSDTDRKALADWFATQRL
jgi:cytochrome c553